MLAGMDLPGVALLLLLQVEAWLSSSTDTMKDTKLTQAAAVANPATDLC
jgi:hypothetical protein